MTSRHKFDVFGTIMTVQRTDGEWHLFKESMSGIRSRVNDIVIPSDVPEPALGSFLDDIYHEMATENHPQVIRLD